MQDEEKKDEQPAPPIEPSSGEDDPAAGSSDSPSTQTPAEPEKALAKISIGHRLKNWYGTHKKISIPLTVIILLAVLAGLPWTRYQAAGLIVKQNMVVQVMDSTAGTPVSGATVSIGPVSSETDAAGKAVLYGVKAGNKKLAVTKKYYSDSQSSVLVPILKPKDNIKISLVATGRQVKVVVNNLITKQPLKNVDVLVSDIESKTDTNGATTLVLPAGLSTAKATLKLDGYLDGTATIEISNKSIKENDFSMTPAGRVYFLSNRTGKLSVMKANLDGSDANVVVSGTGYEDPNNTKLIMSPDQKYVALLAKRSASDSGPQLYILSTNDDKLLNVDSGNATFTAVGWYNNYFVYTVGRSYLQPWQPNGFSIKSYNAQSGQLISLVNTSATGTSNADAEYENIWDMAFLGNNLVYTKTWYRYPGYLDVSGKQNVLAAIRPDGTGAKTLKSVDASVSYFSNLRLNNPGQIIFGVYSMTSSNSTYYNLDKNGNVNQDSSITDNTFMASPTNFFISPSRQATFWDDERDGKSDLLLADSNGENEKTIGRFDPAYHAYGWYTDDYLLVSKNDSELYIMAKAGTIDQTGLIKITDYQAATSGY